MVEGNQAIAENETYQASITALKKEVDRKEAVIVSQITKNKTCYQLADSLTAQVRSMDFVITTQRETIRKLGVKPKYWGVGLVAGYGFSLGTTVSRSPFIGVAVYRQLFKF